MGKFLLRKNHSGMETYSRLLTIFYVIQSCVRTIVVWKLPWEIVAFTVALYGLRKNHSGMETWLTFWFSSHVLVLRENHSGILRAVVGGSWLVVGQEQRTRTRSSSLWLRKATRSKPTQFVILKSSCSGSGFWSFRRTGPCSWTVNGGLLLYEP